MKSAKSRIDSAFTLGSRAKGFFTNPLLPEDVEPVLRGTVRAGKCCDPNWLSLSALTRGYTVTEELGFGEDFGDSVRFEATGTYRS